MRYDVVIVGAGSAGGVLASRLSEDEHRTVLLLEAGPDYGSTVEGQPADVADATRMVEGHDWGHTGRIAAEVPLFAGKLVGGGSAVNMAMTLRGHPADYDAWAEEGNDGWEFDAVLPYFRRVESDLDFGDQPWHGNHGPVPIRRPDGPELIPAHAAFLRAAGERGHPYVPDHNAPAAMGVGPQPLNAVDGVRESVALTYLRQARTRPNLTIRPGSTVDRVVLAGDRAVGVRLASGTLVEGATIVLAAGAYGSPALLLRSGIDLPGIGRNLHDHPLLRMKYSMPDESAPLLHQAMLTARSSGDGPYDLQVFPSGPIDGVLTLLVALMTPHSRGAVTMREITPGHLSAPEDLAPIVAGMRLAREIAAASPLAERVSEELWPGAEVRSDEDLADAAAATMNTYHHAVGTCRMGPANDPLAVVDSSGRVHGVKGLRVADASAMPTIPRANTNLPTLMLAEKLADSLKAA